MTLLPFINLMSISEALGTSIFGFVLVIAVLAVLAVFVKILSAVFGGNSDKKEKSTSEETPVKPTPAPVSEPIKTATPEVLTAVDSDSADIPHIPGYVVLDGVSEQDAAVVMAITSHKTGIDLSRLDFKSIKRLNQNPVLENVEEQDAAAIMAITADKTGIPLENLIFNSIKLVEE